MAKVELKNELPQDQQERKRLSKTIEEMVEVMLQLQDLKEALKDIVDSEKEIHQYKPTMLKLYAKLEYDKRYKAEKERKSLEEKVEKLNELDILMGRSE